MAYVSLESIRSIAERVFYPSRLDAAQWFMRIALAAMGMSALTLGMLLLDNRMIGNEAVWLKPFKFSVSFWILFITLAMATKRLSERWRKSWILMAGVLASAVAFLFEIAYISAQAARRETSHFNESSPFHEMMYGLMGTGATALMAVIAIVGFAAWGDRGARLGGNLRLGIALGFALTVVLTMWIAGELAGNGGRFIGTPAPDSFRIPGLGWSMTVGDLRPAHFFALHAMQVIPAAGYFADRAGLSARMVWISAGLYATFTVTVFFQALRGVPFVGS
jgi:hypothetical protein